MSKKIFISHATKDKEIAESIVDDLLCVTLGISSDDIFCSSLPETGIPNGLNFIEYIKSQIQEPEIVIVILSQAYLQSQFCLCELGATWAMTHKMLPLLVPPLTYDDTKGILVSTQIEKINDSIGIAKFLEAVTAHLGLKTKLSKLDRKRADFLAKVEKYISNQNNKPSIKLEDFTLLEKKYSDAQSEISNLELEVASFKERIRLLEQCKDQEEVEQIAFETNTDEQVQFDALVYDAKRLFKNSPSIVNYIIYKSEYANVDVIFNNFEDVDKIKEAQDAVENGYLIFNDPVYTINDEDLLIDEIISTLNKLNDFALTASEDFLKSFKKNNFYELSLSNKRFWKNHFERVNYL